ncbi:MAG: hypothetical protein RML45_03710 [Acetobacteraceae bacterium]|nr:hypothetical protein [Acetobacteraceae bacterium]
MTAFYCGGRHVVAKGADAELFGAEARGMMTMKLTMRVIAGLALFVLAYTILFSTAAMNGRTLVLDYRTIRSERDAATSTLLRVDVPILAEVFPNVSVDGRVRRWRIHPRMGRLDIDWQTGTDLPRVRAYRDPGQVALCETLDDASVAFRINEAQRREWNR